ncbi:MAG: hypothetical protein IJ534_04760 [Bacteroidaceae bacterium]|nr:hypothetical protein [Bacteroidaceae bacterium]
MESVKVVKNKYFSRNENEWKSFFLKKKEQIEENIEVYLEIKKIVGLDSSKDLFKQWLFFAFYGMRGNLDKSKKLKFIEHFSKIHDNSIDVVKEIVNEINNDEDSTSYYSFVTKMLNIQNEDYFPIYDSRVASVFFEENERHTLGEVDKCYKRIKELYDSISDKDASITAFKAVFESAKSLGKMRVLDFILYNSIELPKRTRKAKSTTLNTKSREG